MKLMSFRNKKPQLGEGFYASHDVTIIGDAKFGKNVNIWFNSVIRADVNSIEVGENTNIQDMCMLHVTEETDVKVGKNTSLGHNVVLHGCHIGEGCLIGMGSIILDGAEVGDHCLVAAGSLISPNKKFPPGSFIKGRPAKVERSLTPEEIHRISNHYKSYIGYKDEYLAMEDSSL